VNYAVKIDYLFPLLRYVGVAHVDSMPENDLSTVSAIAESEKSVALVMAGPKR